MADNPSSKINGFIQMKKSPQIIILMGLIVCTFLLKCANNESFWKLILEVIDKIFIFAAVNCIVNDRYIVHNWQRI